MSAADVLEALYPLLITHGKPHYIRPDNGPEFTAEVFQKWLSKVGIKPIRIYPGSPWENGYNGTPIKWPRKQPRWVTTDRATNM